MRQQLTIDPATTLDIYTCPQAGTDPIFDFTDATDDDCMNKFTPGQTTQMRTSIATCKPSF